VSETYNGVICIVRIDFKSVRETKFRLRENHILVILIVMIGVNLVDVIIVCELNI
jgi:hypothetical protein